MGEPQLLFIFAYRYILIIIYYNYTKYEIYIIFEIPEYVGPFLAVL